MKRCFDEKALHQEINTYYDIFEHRFVSKGLVILLWGAKTFNRMTLFRKVFHGLFIVTYLYIHFSAECHSDQCHFGSMLWNTFKVPES